MKKYNLSAIMKRAWELVKKIGATISEALRTAWKEAKSMKEQLIKKLEFLVNEAASENWHYNVVVRDWENYGKSRTYFKIVKTRENSRHYSEYDFGYYDNQTEKYVPGKCNLEENYTLSGARF